MVSFIKPVRVPFTNFCSFVSPGLDISWVHSHVKYEPITSEKQISSAKAALKETVEVQASANKIEPNNASSFNYKPSSTFQLVVASVDWKSKAISNNHSEHCVLMESKAECHSSFS
jgi:hypothetical protein